ncbi:MAG TPA: S1-like domain-containing RNA-binding protein [Polyangiaceae bacterium]|nr:S1-like domain-containing RNA-binding protein [Polyangiaceae bacterium]
MPVGDFLGQVVSLLVRRFAAPGVFLAVDEGDERPDAEVVLLPRAEVPDGLAVGDRLEVFVYLDSEDRPVATLKRPKVRLGEVAFLEVTDLTSFGAFVDWGLPKELLVPLAEQTRDLSVGTRHPVGLFIDKTGRLAGTMKVGELLKTKPTFARDAWVEGEAWRKDDDVGVFVIVERQFVGLLPAFEPHSLARGESAKFRVTNVLVDGKIELSLRGKAHEELENDASKILAVLTRPHAPKVGDRSDPEQIRSAFGLSKKAFKRAVGTLLKTGRVKIDARGFLALVTLAMGALLAACGTTPAENGTADAGSQSSVSSAQCMLLACPAVAQPGDGHEVSLRAELAQTLQRNCADRACHGDAAGSAAGLYLGPETPAAFDTSQMRQRLVGVPSRTAPAVSLVRAGDPSRSFLMFKVDGCQGAAGFACTPQPGAHSADACGDNMPQEQRPLCNRERELLRLWILQGAKDN